MRKLLYIFIATILFAACAGSGRERAALDAAQAVINHRPDSALAILDSLEPSSQDFSRSTLRRWQLLRLMAQNKCDTVFRSDSLQLILTDYYDRHGTPNEKMWAFYLLGRAYYDMGEALPALKAYEEASAAADTSAADCDYWNLCRVYHQEALLLYYQNLPDEILETLENASIAAKKSGDTISDILCYERRAMAYERLGKRDSMAVAGMVASAMYHDIGRDQMAARALYWVIPYNIENGDLNMAKKHLDIYESQSGLFDENHNISVGREHYYSTKGNYYLASSQLDSAESYFRKCLFFSSKRNVIDVSRDEINCKHASFKGLSALYRIKNMNDSTAKYSYLSEIYNDSMRARSYIEISLITKKLYDYTKIAEKSQDKIIKLKSCKRNLIISLLLSLVLFFSTCSIITILLIKSSKKNQQLEHIISCNKGAHQLSQFDLVPLTQIEREEINRQLLASDIYQEFVRLTKHVKEKANPKQWKLLDELFFEQYHPFYSKIHSIKDITDTEIKVCELIKLRFRPSEIATIMDYDKSYISNLRTNLHKKIYGKEGKASDVDIYLLSI